MTAALPPGLEAAGLETATAPLVLATHGLTKRYGRIEVVSDLDLHVPRGAIFGLVGLNGAGKTTTLECALGLQRFQRGRVELLGEPLRGAWNGRVAATFDQGALHPHLTVRQQLRYAEHVAFRGEGRRADELIDALALTRYAGRKTSRLSLGNRRRTAIATSLIGRPELVVLDEPFSGLDAEGVDDLLALLQRIHGDDGTTFLISSHQLPLLERVCSHLAFLHEGKLLRDGSVEELLAGEDDQVEIRVSDLAAAEGVLGAFAGVRVARSSTAPDDERRRGEGLEISGDVDASELNSALVRAGVRVHALRPRRRTVDALFRRLLEDA